MIIDYRILRDRRPPLQRSEVAESRADSTDWMVEFFARCSPIGQSSTGCRRLHLERAKSTSLCYGLCFSDFVSVCVSSIRLSLVTFSRSLIFVFVRNSYDILSQHIQTRRLASSDSESDLESRAKVKLLYHRFDYHARLCGHMWVRTQRTQFQLSV